MRTRGRTELSALDAWFDEIWQYRRSAVEAMKNLPTFVEAAEMRVRTLVAGVFGCLSDASDRLLLCDALVYRCDLFCTRDGSAILKLRKELARLPIEILTPAEWWSRIQPVAGV